ncbi:hypothetical protein [Williamsia sterculiae]|uniref:Hydroxymethylpyrimidine pyrophosphatase n=1 Tax=Williamsia sterculiae TaxID=1344003 RepID=A0A1N7EP47_9NOCA|nr:hypothetical protein [Williamsia sterculiae]SIR89809.1 Hydroxymethylpyrimidine pyrophosphatase [Williamsia sterculiae]
MTAAGFVPPTVVLDLDRTLIYSRAAAGAVSQDALRCVEVYRDNPQSFMTVPAMGLLERLTTRATVVPCTTRTVEQYRRVRLPLPMPRYAVAANGGTLLCDGEPDAQWHRRVRDRLRRDSAPLSEVAALFSADAGSAWMHATRLADDLFCYAVVDVAALPDDRLPRWRDAVAARGWNLSRQGRKVYLMPDGLTKMNAVDEILDRIGGSRERLFAAGDGALDIPVLAAAAGAIRPRHGELEELGWSAPSVAVTDSDGASAAEELLTWLTQQVETDSVGNNGTDSVGDIETDSVGDIETDSVGDTMDVSAHHDHPGAHAGERHYT